VHYSGGGVEGNVAAVLCPRGRVPVAHWPHWHRSARTVGKVAWVKCVAHHILDENDSQ